MEMYFIRLEDGEKISLEEAIKEEKNSIRAKGLTAIADLLIMSFIDTADLAAKYLRGEKTPASDPFEALAIFLYFIDKGFYPPAPFLRWLETALSKVHNSTDKNRPTIDGLLGIEGVKHAKKASLDSRDLQISRDYHILRTHFGLSQEDAGGMVINKYIVLENKIVAPGFMIQSLIEKTGFPESARRIAQIYKKQQQKNPKADWDVSEDFNKKKFLNSFAEDDVEELIYHNRTILFKK